MFLRVKQLTRGILRVYNSIATKLVGIKNRSLIFMKFSAKTHYGLRACHMLALAYPDMVISASVLQKGVNVSSKYIEKIMRILSSRGIVAADRGASGGYYLVKKPSEITVGEIVRALEDDFEFAPCVNNDCYRCASSSVWKKLYSGVNEVLDAISLKDMSEDFIKEEKTRDCGGDCFKKA